MPTRSVKCFIPSYNIQTLSGVHFVNIYLYFVEKILFLVLLNEYIFIRCIAILTFLSLVLNKYTCDKLLTSIAKFQIFH